MSQLQVVRVQRKVSGATAAKNSQKGLRKFDPVEHAPVAPTAQHRLGETFRTKITETRNPGLQTRLGVVNPGDMCEKEADEVAERIVDGSQIGNSRLRSLLRPSSMGAEENSEYDESSKNAYAKWETATSPGRITRGTGKAAGEMSEPRAGRFSRHIPGLPQRQVVQSKCAGCETGALCPKCEEEETARRGTKPGGTSSPYPSVPVMQDVGSGLPLDPATQSFMEMRFGRDFSQVRVHTNEAAAESARALNALAYTVGQDIVFGKGTYKPGTPEGNFLLAHELTHVVQQGGGASRPGTEVEPGAADDYLEREAERVAGETKLTSWPGAGDFTSEERGKRPVETIALPSVSGLCVQRASIPGAGGITIPLPDLTVIPRFDRSLAWAGSTGNIPLAEKPIDIPYVGPVVFTLYVRGDVLAGLTAGLGPGVVRNISVTLDPLARRYSGTGQLFVPAELIARVMLGGTIGGSAHWLGLVEVGRIEGGLLASGSGTLATAFIATGEVVYDKGNVRFSLGTELDTCLVFAVSLDALATASLLRHPVWSRSWHLAGYTWRRCWRIGAKLAIAFAGGLPTVSLDFNAEAVPVSDLLTELLAAGHGAGALLGAKAVPVRIRGGSELWWFNGERPPGYSPEQALAADAGGLPGTFRWSVIRGVGFADFDGFPTAVGPSAKIKSRAPSVARNDVEIKVEFHGAGGETGSATKTFAVQAPDSLNPLGVTHSAIPRGWRSLVGYGIRDQFSITLPRQVEVNEEWDDKPPIPDFKGTNWPSFPPTEGHALVSPAKWNDVVSIADGSPPVLVPKPLSPGGGGPLVQHFRGHWQVGSPAKGRGRRVRNVTWRFFQDHGDHA